MNIRTILETKPVKPALSWDWEKGLNQDEAHWTTSEVRGVLCSFLNRIQHLEEEIERLEDLVQDLRASYDRSITHRTPEDLELIKHTSATRSRID